MLKLQLAYCTRTHAYRVSSKPWLVLHSLIFSLLRREKLYICAKMIFCYYRATIFIFNMCTLPTTCKPNNFSEIKIIWLCIVHTDLQIKKIQVVQSFSSNPFKFTRLKYHEQSRNLDMQFSAQNHPAWKRPSKSMLFCCHGIRRVRCVFGIRHCAFYPQ